MGGAVGHIMHPYDNRNITFGEIKEMLELAFQGKLENVTEKFDGLNLVITYDFNDCLIKVARNLTEIKTGGLDYASLEEKFSHNISVQEAFVNAYTILQKAVFSLSNDQLVSIFGDNKNYWYSIEVVYVDKPNVINYDSNNIVFHINPRFVLNNGVVTKETNLSENVLQKYVDQMQYAVAERNWRLVKPNLVTLNNLSNKSVLNQSLQMINELMIDVGIEDHNTLLDYLYNRCFSYCKYHFSDKLSDILAKKLIDADDKMNLIHIKKICNQNEFLKLREILDKKNEIIESFLFPIETAIRNFSIELLNGLKSTLIKNHDEESVRIKNTLQDLIVNLSTYNNKLSDLQKQLDKIPSDLNFDIAMEGIVFKYKDNLYKFTGAFGPINRIFWMLK